MALKNKKKIKKSEKEILIRVSSLPLSEYFNNEYIRDRGRIPDEFELNEHIKRSIEYLR